MTTASAHTASARKWLHDYVALLLVVLLQFGFWHNTRHIRPDIGIVPDVPGKPTIQAMAFGDEEFFFRVLSFTLQNAGDMFGRFTSLRYYDFNKLTLWFTLLDGLDARSNMIPFMATYYFAQTQNTTDIRYIVDYLYDHGTHDIGHKWWWLVQAIYLSLHKLEDKDLALKVAMPLVDPKVPIWAQQMAAVVHEKRGEMEDALGIMQTIQDNMKEIPDKDLRYMTYFVKERLEKLESLEKEHMLRRLEAMRAKQDAQKKQDAEKKAGKP